MATETLRPNAAGDVTTISNQGPSEGFHWDKVDEASSDGQATTVRTSAETTADEYDLYNLPASSGSGTISSVRVYIRCKYDRLYGDKLAYTKIKTGGTEYTGNEIDMTTGFVAYNTEYVENPNTTTAWTWADIDALQIGVRLSVSGGGESSGDYTDGYCTQVYVEVDYTSVVGWAGGDVLGVDIATVSKINGVALVDIVKVSGVA